MYHPLVGLDQCTRAPLNAVLWVEIAKWPCRSRSMPSIFNSSRKNPKIHIWWKFGDSSSNPLKVTKWDCLRMHVWCKFGDSSPNLWRVIARTSRISYNSESKWPKWPWRSRSITPIFNTNREHAEMHVWYKLVIPAQICDDLSCGQSKIYGRTATDGQTQATTIFLRPERLRGKNKW